MTHREVWHMTTLGPQVGRESETPVWRDKKRRLWLMGLIAPTALFVMLPIIWGMNQLGWHTAAQVPLWIGPILLYVLLPIHPRSAFRARRSEPARRGDGTAGERQALPLLHLRLHPVPVPQRAVGRPLVHRLEPELAGL